MENKNAMTQWINGVIGLSLLTVEADQYAMKTTKIVTR